MEYCLTESVGLSMEIEYERQIIEIRSIYKQLLENYHELNKVFGLDNPTEIYTMFEYLLRGGYLSKNKEFESGFRPKEQDNKDLSFGVVIFNGSGVCRHMSELLVDVFRTFEIKSQWLTIKVNAQIHHPDSLTRFLRVFLGNHAVTLAVKDGKCYFFDVINSTIHRVSPINPNVLIPKEERDYTTEEIYNINLILHYLLDFHLKTKSVREIKSWLLLPSSSFEEDKIMMERVHNICEGNQDIFERFYQENNEGYHEISSKCKALSLIKKR